VHVFNKQSDTLRLRVMVVHLERILSSRLTNGLTNNHTS